MVDGPKSFRTAVYDYKGFMEGDIVRIVDWHPGYEGRYGEIIDVAVRREPVRHEIFTVELFPDYVQLICRRADLRMLKPRGLVKCEG